jgi:hypothetical protein
LARPTGCGESAGGGGAQQAGVEHCKRRGGAVAVTARRRSQRRAGEQGDLKHARAPGGDGDAIPVLELAEEAMEVGCRR